MNTQDNLDISVIEVGKCYDYLKTKIDGCRIDFDENGGLLFVYLVEPTITEVNNIIKNRLRIKLDVIEGVMMFTIKFNGSLMFDTPYSPQLSKNKIDFHNIPEGRGFALSIVVADAKTGEVKGLRLVALSNKFSHDIAKAVDEVKKTPFNRAEYENTIDKIYNKYSLEQIFDNSKSYCTI